MSAKGKKPLVPRLRFAEFLNEEAWSERKLGEIGNFVSGGTPSTSNPKYWDGNIQWYTPKEIKNRILKPSMRTISKDGLKNSSAKLLPKGAILITTRATIGDVAIANKECATNQGFQSLVVNETEVNLFWYYWILLYKNELIKRSSGSTFKEIRKTKIEVIPTFSPNKEEQQKIAACLTALDDLISAATGRLDALKQHKQGLMQQLFPAEGETVPRLRFAEFRDAGEWVEKRLGEICNMQAGKFVPASNIKEQISDGLYPCYGGNGLRGYTETFTHVGMYSLIGRQGALCGNVMLVAQQFYATEHAVVVTPNEKVSTIWLYYVLSYLNLNRFSTGQAQPGLSVENLNNVEIMYAPESGEQQKIAACLTALDDLISAQTQKIAELKTHKRGLMQQLFPAVDETHR